MFHKSADPPEAVTQEQVLAAVRAAGEEVLGVVTDRPDECHVLSKRADGRRIRNYFDAPVEKAAAPAYVPQRIDPATLSPATLAKLAAKYGGETEEENEMSKSKKLTLEDLHKIAADGQDAQDALRAADDQSAVAFEKRINEIKARDNCGQREAAERAAMEYPDEFEAWQTGSPVISG